MGNGLLEEVFKMELDLEGRVRFEILRVCFPQTALALRGSYFFCTVACLGFAFARYGD